MGWLSQVLPQPDLVLSSPSIAHSRHPLLAVASRSTWWPTSSEPSSEPSSWPSESSSSSSSWRPAARPTRTASRRGELHTSFLLRCWYHYRGTMEGQECQDMRKRFKTHKRVDVLPANDEKKCDLKNVIYIVNGVNQGTSKGSWLPSAPNDTLEFPAETWHKCCAPADDTGSEQLLCERVRLVERHAVNNIYDHRCGRALCFGYRDRCIEEGSVHGYHEFGDIHEPECPKKCVGECLKTFMVRKCIYMGVEPKEGYEGFPKPLDPYSKDRLPYKVIDLGMGKKELMEMEEEKGGAESLL